MADSLRIILSFQTLNQKVISSELSILRTFHSHYQRLEWRRKSPSESIRFVSVIIQYHCSINSISNLFNPSRFLFDDDTFTFGDVLTILRPIFGGVILILFRNTNRDENSLMRTNRSLLFCFNVDHRKKRIKNTGAAVANLVNQFDKAEYNMKFIFFIIRFDFQDVLVPLKRRLTLICEEKFSFVLPPDWQRFYMVYFRRKYTLPNA
jgi:hypothetical protein